MSEDIDAAALFETLVTAAEREGWRISASGPGVSYGFPTLPGPNCHAAIGRLTAVLKDPEVRTAAMAFLHRTGRAV